MKEDIKNFIQQFEFQPKIQNRKDYLAKYKNFIIAGMGGSHLAADLIKDNISPTKIIIHSNYQLPSLEKEELKKYLFIASSYSGNTEETLSALKIAQKNKMDIAIITAGGKLLKIAQRKELPYIQLPANDIQPRLAIGYSLIAMLTFTRQKESLSKLYNLNENIFSNRSMLLSAQNIAKKITEKKLIPLIYSSKSFSSLTYIWKINFNETGKIPTFSNVFPELNHNEMQGFEVLTKNKIYKNFFIIMLQDKQMLSSIQQRIKFTQKIYTSLGLETKIINLSGQNYWEKVLSSINLSQWISYYIALNYHLEPEKVNLVEKFKKLLAKK